MAWVGGLKYVQFLLDFDFLWVGLPPSLGRSPTANFAMKRYFWLSCNLLIFIVWAALKHALWRIGLLGLCFLTTKDKMPGCVWGMNFLLFGCVSPYFSPIC